MTKHVGKILIVDDQDSVQNDYRRSLTAGDVCESAVDAMALTLFSDIPAATTTFPKFQIDSAFQGAEAVELVRASLETGEPYAMAFVDIRMPPGWNGIETTQRIWQLDPGVFIVLCSAYSDHSYEDITQQLGQSDRFLILKKPFDPIEVRQMAMALTKRWRMERTDVLTGTLNRAALEEFLLREWAMAARSGLPLSCAMLDLDHFKKTNDTYGHQAGDQALCSVVDCVIKNCRSVDSVFRIGGEELLILLPNTDELGATISAEKVRSAVAALRLPVGDGTLQLTVSIGVCARSEGTASPAEFMAGADLALRHAKRAGRNRVCRASVVGSDVADSGTMNLNIFAGLCARDVMSPVTHCVSYHATLAEVVADLLNAGRDVLPITDSSGQLVGTVSEWDALRIPWASDAWHAPIEHLMQRLGTYYAEDTPVGEILSYLKRFPDSEIPVVKRGIPVGMIGPGSLLRWYVDSLAGRQQSVRWNPEYSHT